MFAEVVFIVNQIFSVPEEDSNRADDLDGSLGYT